jgi:hypothetical protein
MTTTRTLVGCVVLAAGLTLLGTPAGARPTPGQKCSAAKMRCIARNFTGVMNCQANAALHGTTAASTCLQGAKNAFLSCWNRADAKGGCIATFPAEHLDQDVQDWTADAVSDLPTS